jgi:uncharacterized protein YdcH (DUF465 family)
MFEDDSEIFNNLLNENNDFKRLYSKHEELEQRLEQAYSKRDDSTLGNLKKEKLYVKDKMTTLLENHRHNHSN